MQEEEEEETDSGVGEGKTSVVSCFDGVFSLPCHVNGRGQRCTELFRRLNDSVGVGGVTISCGVFAVAQCTSRAFGRRLRDWRLDTSTTADDVSLVDSVFESHPADECDCDCEVEESFVGDCEDDEEWSEGEEDDGKSVEIVISGTQRMGEREDEGCD